MYFRNFFSHLGKESLKTGEFKKEMNFLKLQFFLEDKAIYLFLLMRLLRESVRIYRISKYIKSDDLNKLSDLDISKYKSSDTLFVMGSGASINDLGDKEWQIIAESNSIGINFWLIHEFVPTYYMFETVKHNSDRLKVLFNLLDLKSRDYVNTPFLVKNIESGHLNLSEIPESLKANLYVPYKIVIPGFRQSTFSRSLNLINILKLHEVSNFLFFKRASISQAISFGLKMKYKEIVLCGVDLNNTQYFYEDSEYCSKNIPLPEKIQRGSIHRIADPNYGNLTIDIIIDEMNRCLLKANNVRLYIGSKKSALYPMLPYYFD